MKCEADHDYRVNGVAIQSCGYELHALFASATAADCVVTAPGSTEIVVGSTNSFKLSVSDAKKLAVRFDGSEDVTAFLSGMGSATRYGHSQQTMPLACNNSCFSAQALVNSM